MYEQVWQSHTPLHEKLCAICKLDLATGKAKNFQSCEHALHENCWEHLVSNTLEGEKCNLPSLPHRI